MNENHHNEGCLVAAGHRGLADVAATNPLVSRGLLALQNHDRQKKDSQVIETGLQGLLDDGKMEGYVTCRQLSDYLTLGVFRIEPDAAVKVLPDDAANRQKVRELLVVLDEQDIELIDEGSSESPTITCLGESSDIQLHEHRFRLQIPSGIYTDMISHAQSDHSTTCCGFLAGDQTTGRVEKLYRLSRDLVTRDSCLSTTLFQAYKEINRLDLDLLAVYSCVFEPLPSRRDFFAETFGDAVMSLLISLEASQPEIRAWWWVSDDECREAFWERC